MSLGSWDPAAAAATTSIDTPTLERFIEYSRNDTLQELDTLIEPTDQQTLAGLMTLPQEQWAAAAQAVDTDDLRHLIRFLAVAENLPGWEAGEKSPVIPLAKVLRKRGERLDKAFLLWLREVNENRFLPYGPL